MEAVQIDLKGFSADEIASLRDQLERVAQVREEGEEGTVEDIQAHGVSEVLQTVLADTTLIAEIAAKVGEAAASVAALLATIKTWRAGLKARPGQQVSISGPHSDGTEE